VSSYPLTEDQRADDRYWNRLVKEEPAGQDPLAMTVLVGLLMVLAAALVVLGTLNP
jgi:hypothetical protein